MVGYDFRTCVRSPESSPYDLSRKRGSNGATDLVFLALSSFGLSAALAKEAGRALIAGSVEAEGSEPWREGVSASDMIEDGKHYIVNSSGQWGIIIMVRVMNVTWFPDQYGSVQSRSKNQKGAAPGAPKRSAGFTSKKQPLKTAFPPGCQVNPDGK